MARAHLSDDQAMTTVIDPVATREPVSQASSSMASAKLRTFAVTFAIVGPILYFACLFWNLPLFTYHPAMNRIDFGWTPARSGEGPAMYWYGWTLTVLFGGTMVSLLATLVPERVTLKIPLYLVWLVPLLAIPLLAYSLREFWSHP
jgi:hypothetical protein